jgi:hypothetical protein
MAQSTKFYAGYEGVLKIPTLSAEKVGIRHASGDSDPD